MGRYLALLTLVSCTLGASPPAPTPDSLNLLNTCPMTEGASDPLLGVQTGYRSPPGDTQRWPSNFLLAQKVRTSGRREQRSSVAEGRTVNHAGIKWPWGTSRANKWKRVSLCLQEQRAGSAAMKSGSSHYLVTHNSCSEQLGWEHSPCSGIRQVRLWGW